MGIPLIFWVVTIAMALLAFSVIAKPLKKLERRMTSAIVTVAFAFAVVSLGMYWAVGSRHEAKVESNATAYQDNWQQAARKSQNSQSQNSIGSVSSLVDGLAQRMKQNPDDSKGWLLLAQSYQHLGRTAEAIAAYEKAAALGIRDEKLERLSGLSSGNYETQPQVLGNVRLADDSRDIVLPTDTVFIFARAVDGPPMPVAVLRRPAADLPIDFLLNDSQALSTDARLSDFEQIIVTARISRTGNESDALQELEARSEVIAVADNRHLNLTIQ